MKSEIAAFKARLRREVVPFADTLALIDALYRYTPTAFSNGVGEDALYNEAGENEGSCKVFAFATLQSFSEGETLACFGEHYKAVIENPSGDDHPNIRVFMRDGWAGIRFEGTPLVS